MARRVFYYAGRAWPDPRNTRAWRKLAARVAREEPICWLRLPGCTTKSTTADHIIPVSERPDLGMDRTNLRGACQPCNHKRNDTPIDQLHNLRNQHTPPALHFFD